MTKGYELKIEPQLPYPKHGNVWDLIYDKHFLAHDPQNFVISQFQRRLCTTIPSENNREVYRWRLQYMGHFLHDDYFYQAHMPFIHWLATMSHENYFGYYADMTNTFVLPMGLFVTPDRLLETRKLWLTNESK
ncbi:MAG: hypothetical protein KJ043_05195, partial [Anaerolineae bacterium]|nr:hypothetical protein [Anaerolineae bacterium]